MAGFALLLCLSTFLAAWPWSAGYCQSSLPSAYDEHFKASYTRHLAPWYPAGWWRFWGQCYAEAGPWWRTDPRAAVTIRSAAGAVGVCQLLPGTFADAGGGLIYLPADNIRAGAITLATYARIFKAPRPALDFLRTIEASYNAGPLAVIRAQNKAGGTRQYQLFMAYLPAETRAYIPRLERLARRKRAELGARRRR